MVAHDSGLMVDSVTAQTEQLSVEPSVSLEPSEIRKRLPTDLKTWRGPSGKDKDRDPMEAIWKTLGPFFADRGYTLWEYQCFFMTAVCEDGVVANGYMYSTPFRAYGEVDTPGSVQGILSYEYRNALTRAARAADGRDVVFRLLAIGEEGREHVDFLKTFARGPYSLLSANHTLPLLDMIELEDITFAVFPKVGCACTEVYNTWAQSSVGDILDMIAQCLEALVFLHHHGVAHRDAFKDNFLIQWVPESLRSSYKTPPARPRVYMNDFELAISFPVDMPPEERVCVGPPYGGSLPGHSGRPMPPEVLSGEPYDPFKLDVWQLGTSINDFKSTIPQIDAVLVSMADPDPANRPTAYEAMKALLDAIGALPPVSLRINPELVPRYPVKLST